MGNTWAPGIEREGGTLAGGRGDGDVAGTGEIKTEARTMMREIWKEINFLMWAC